VCLTTACETGVADESTFTVPSQSDWIDCGSVLQAGRPGDWDLYLWGGFAGTVVKRHGEFLFYYQGADGYNDVEGTVTHRAIGLARSADGIHFNKDPRNPVLTFAPSGQHEEGAVSSAVLVNDSGGVTIYYGANTWIGGDRVSADARRAVSADGAAFTDQGVVLDHRDGTTWGSGDEIFPVLALRDGRREIVYYIPNGTAQMGRLGVAWSDDGAFERSAMARNGLRGVDAWGPASAARIAPDLYALFLSYVRGEEAYIDVRMVSPASPAELGERVERYEWSGIVPRAVFFDEDTGRWHLYYRKRPDPDHYGVMIAPASAQRC
jgi:hypothetical protein